MRAEIDQDLCIACGLCTGICESVFSSCANGTVHAMHGEVPMEAEESARIAAESCPTDAIRIEE